MRPFQSEEEQSEGAWGEEERPASTTEAEIAGLVTLESFQVGGRVERTGIALVHEGEYIVPALGSEALIAPETGASASAQVINYYFPVEIEVVGRLNEAQMEAVADYVFAALEAELSSRR